MEYYIVMNEWNYPTGSGRKFINDFDNLHDAEIIAKAECNKELYNFQNVCSDLYKDGSGRMVNAYMDCEGYVLHSSQYEEEDFFFRSIIIKREVI